MPRCLECNIKFKPKYFLQKYCLTNERCINVSVKNVLNFNSPEAIEKRHEKLKVEVQGTALLEKAARAIFQQWVRERDKHHPCISCGTKHTPQFDAGHYFKAELYSGLIFEETNVHKQCCYCNGPNMHANLVEYRKGLIARYGEEYVWELESISNQNRQYSWSRQELVEIAAKYKRKLQELKNK